MNSLVAVKNRLEKEDRKNHAKLVKDSIETKSKLRATRQKQITTYQKELVMKKTFDAALELRNDFK